MALVKNDIELPAKIPDLLKEKHVKFLLTYANQKIDELILVMTEHMRLSGMYWCLTALDVLDELNKVNKEEVISFIKQCHHPDGGFSPSIDHDPHMLYTLSAIQILCLFDALDTIDTDKVVEYIKKRQKSDGSFEGDQWGEIDTRFSFCAIASLSLLGRLTEIDIPKAVEFIKNCMNFDCGFGAKVGAESHAGMIYCCLGALSITRELCMVEEDSLGWWLCERQLTSGGFNGRPEKLPDVCYSWWVLSSLFILNRADWISKEKLINFILACQDEESGGFSDRPGDEPDPFHTLFGLAALSMLKADKTLKPINPVYCMPQYVIDRLGLKPEMLRD